MKKQTFMLIILLSLFATSCKDYYNEPHPMKFKSNYDKTLFNMQSPNILKAIGYEIEVINEENNYVKAYKYLSFKGKDIKLFFEISYPEDEIELNTYLHKDKNYYIDKNKFPEEIETMYIQDVESFISRAKGGVYPNKP